jgi:hypothetical protein
VLKLHSGIREGSYLEDNAQEQEGLLNAMRMPDVLRVNILGRAREPFRLRTSSYLRRRLLTACGIHPRARAFRRKHKRGAFVAMLRRMRGLPPMPEREPSLSELLDRYRELGDAGPDER